MDMWHSKPSQTISPPIHRGYCAWGVMHFFLSFFLSNMCYKNSVSKGFMIIITKKKSCATTSKDHNHTIQKYKLRMLFILTNLILVNQKNWCDWLKVQILYIIGRLQRKNIGDQIWLRCCSWHELWCFLFLFSLSLSLSSIARFKGTLSSIASFHMWTPWTSANMSSCTWVSSPRACPQVPT